MPWASAGMVTVSADWTGLGTAYPAAQKMNANGLRFEVSFAFDEKDEPRKVAELQANRGPL